MRYLLPLACTALLIGCKPNPVSQEHFAQLEAGMPRSEVEALLGKPSECAGALGMLSCTWGDRDRFISIQYAGDRVMMFSGKGLQ